MIKVIIKKSNNLINNIEISGHAYSDEPGKDLICAGVSALSTGILNTLDEYGFINENIGNIEIDKGYININVFDTNKHDIQVILETLEISLSTIEDGYSKYLKITYMEV